MIFCNRCAAYSPKGTAVCPGCNADLAAFGHESMSASRIIPQAVSTSVSVGAVNTSNYGTFLDRLLAAIVDALILTVVIGVLFAVLTFGLGGGLKMASSPGAAMGSAAIIFTIGIVVIMLVPVFYEVVMIGTRGATYGKAFRKLIVVRPNGEPVGMGRSILRMLVKTFLSGILLIGYLMPLFTAKKQALHDLIADTVVVSQ